MTNSRRQCGNGGRDYFQERGSYELQILLILYSIVDNSLRRVQIVAVARRKCCHRLDEGYDQVPQIVVPIDSRKR